MSYRYSLLRFVPDPGRGEFVNIGAIAGDDDAQDWALRLLSNYRRARSIDDDREALPIAIRFAASLESHIDALEQLPSIRPVEPISVGLLQKLAREMANVVQISEPAPVVASSAEAALDLVFEEQLLDPALRRFRFEKKHRAVRLVRQTYGACGVPTESVAESVQVFAGEYGDQFDFGVHNSHVVQLVRCWSFQLPDQAQLAEELKAWAWTANALQHHGGVLARANGPEIPIAANIQIASVYIAPAPGKAASAFDQARAAFDELRIAAVDVDADGLDRVGREAAANLARSA